MNAYWRAANYLSVGQIYLYDNPLLREPFSFTWRLWTRKRREAQTT
jgi:phosphoketolase